MYFFRKSHYKLSIFKEYTPYTPFKLFGIFLWDICLFQYGHKFKFKNYTLKEAQ